MYLKEDSPNRYEFCKSHEITWIVSASNLQLGSYSRLQIRELQKQLISTLVMEKWWHNQPPKLLHFSSSLTFEGTSAFDKRVKGREIPFVSEVFKISLESASRKLLHEEASGQMPCSAENRTAQRRRITTCERMKGGAGAGKEANRSRR